jgi:hypothetical protein
MGSAGVTHTEYRLGNHSSATFLAVDESCYVLPLTFGKVLSNRLITRHPYLEISSNQDSVSRLMIGFVRGPCVKLEASFQFAKSSAGVPEKPPENRGTDLPYPTTSLNSLASICKHLQACTMASTSMRARKESLRK